MHSKILIIDFGSQVTQLIARRVREAGVFSEVVPYDVGSDFIRDYAKDGSLKGVILSGGQNSVTDDDTPRVPQIVFELGVPVLGICYGMQMTHYMNGGSVKACETKEYGRTQIEVKGDSALFKGLPKMQTVWMSHGDQVDVLADGFTVEASSDTCPYAATAHAEKQIYTLQFHPEVRNSEFGLDILRNFVFEICHAKNDWSMHSFVDMQIEKIRAKVGKDKVLLGLSGGVDSSVVAALLHKAIGDQLICMFIDHGLLRKGEAEGVMETFGREMHVHLVKIDAKERFLAKLKGISDPEQKRKIIGNEFVYTFDEEVKKLTQGEDIKWLAQGTLYTDVIESGTKTAQTIKSHHNVGGLPEDMQFQLIEPLNTLFKDEVRQVGRELGLPEYLVSRQPFPGPGLGVRCTGAITRDRLEAVREADAIVREEIEKMESLPWQYFVAIPDVKSTGIKDGKRYMGWAAVIRAINTVDAVTAESVEIPFDMLRRMRDRIIAEVPGINRVLWDISDKPVATIEWE